VITPAGIRDYVENIAKQYQINYSYQELNLLADFQLKIEGDINPNLYNNVIDSNFALAINDKLTIAQALEKNKLIGDFKFSWDEYPESGTYHLANIKKLRKARVVPLGLELAAELIKDCNYRKEINPSFEDIDNSARQGLENFDGEPFKTQRLQNCLFKPYAGLGVEVLSDVRELNIVKMNQVLNATLSDVVDGFDKGGSGICGDFDINESPFCNLVDPNWVLKLPITQCSSQTDLEPYSELLRSNQTGQRYASCPDFASCLQEDGKGGCIKEDYGFCVKEKNSWLFASESCPAEFNSCSTFKLTDAQGTRNVSYLKNTLSGSDVCGSYNAGCSWYATKTVNDLWEDFNDLNSLDCIGKGGTYLEGRGCQSERIYLNRYAQICDRDSEGCNEFNLYRDPSNNLVFDSSFEYTETGRFPQNWDLRLKKQVADQTECQDNYYETCYVDGSFNSNISEAECSGEYIKYCIESILKTNLCFNPQFADDDTNAQQTKCNDNGGTWIEECEVDGVIESQLSSLNTCEPEDGSCQASCEENNGSWLQYCQGAVLYGSDTTLNPQNQDECNNLLGEWLGEGPFSDIAHVSKLGVNVYAGLSKLEIDIGNLAANEELQLVYKSQFADGTSVLTKGGDVYTASAYISTNQSLSIPIGFNLIKTNLSLYRDLEANEINSMEFYPGEIFDQAEITLVTSNPGTELDILITLPGAQPGATVYLDAVDLSLNTINQLRNYDFSTPYSDYELNRKLYYKKPPARLECHGYGPGDPPPVIEDFDPNVTDEERNCQEVYSGYYDKELIYKDTPDCYKYEPDKEICNNFMKKCEINEVGCQLYTPVNGDPSVPGVVSATDYCPAECVGFETYKQESTLYEPEPENLYNYFIPETAAQCSYAEVGCSQFTNLDEVAKGGEGIEYFTYLRQCIKPNLGLGEKTFFTWQGSASGPPQLVKYEFQADSVTGAPKTINDETDCRIILGDNDLNCINFFDNQGVEYYRDIRKTVSVSESCLPYRKTQSTQENCENTNGRWQSEIAACIYDAIPGEAIACNASANNCREYIGNQGNNIFVQIFDNFETSPHDWDSDVLGIAGNLSLVGESVQVGGHSLFVPENVNSISKPVDISVGSFYNISFWAKAETEGEKLEVKFSTAQTDNNDSTIEEFASTANQIELTREWKSYNLGPVLVSWPGVADTELVFGEIDGGIYLDNITLKAIRDHVYVVKDSWDTPYSCNQDIFGNDEPLAMLGCQAYDDLSGQRHNLKSFTNLCRESAIGCHILIDTKNSISANKQIFNEDNLTDDDDYTVPKDELVTFVVNNDYLCNALDKGCQRLGRPIFEGIQSEGFKDIYIRNNPDKYFNVPGAIMCNDDSLGCTELINEFGGAEYYKIKPTNLCQYREGTVLNQNVKGWFKKGSQTLGCGSLDDKNTSAIIEDSLTCTKNGGSWSELYNQCVVILNDVTDPETCLLQNGEWTADAQCLAYPFTIYKVYEANKYKGYVGECDKKWGGCTEFVDINPNFVANGSFEFRIDNRISNWTTVAGQSGSIREETENVRLGSKAVKLIKRTGQDCPTTATSEACEADPFGISQKVAFLEKGRIYKVSFYYNVPNDAAGKGEACPMPEAAIQLNRYIDLENNEVIPGPLIVYQPENGWKKVEYFITIPHGECSDASFDKKVACESVVDGGGLPLNTWTEYEDIQNYQIVLYAPRNENQSANINNCPESYILYDQVEIKDNTEDKYYVIDTGSNLDRKSCKSIDWEIGCVQFLNTLSDTSELLKVKRDRNCAEWALCSEINEEGVCEQVDLCQEESAGECIKYSAKKDNVRYDLDSEPLVVKRISDYGTNSGYIYRFGSGAFNQLNRWRAGDYSGYTIANRYPLEAETEKGFTRYTYENDLGSKFDRRAVSKICKIFPEENSPLPYDLSLNQTYSDISEIYSQDYENNSDDLGSMCTYEEISVGGSVITYFPAGAQVQPNQEICLSPENLKGAIATGQSCTSQPIEIIKTIEGLEGMCLEFDTLNPVYADIYNDTYKDCVGGTAPVSSQEECATVGGNWQGVDYQPYSCLTFYPFITE